MEEEAEASINSELRFIAIELSKLAAQKGTTFDMELDEFIDNTYKLRQAILGMSPPVQRIERK